MDYVDGSSWTSTGDVITSSRDFAHSYSKGWNVLFTDNSVEFKRVNAATKSAYLNSGFTPAVQTTTSTCFANWQRMLSSDLQPNNTLEKGGTHRIVQNDEL